VALHVDRLGTRYREQTATIEARAALAYAAATNDANPVYRSGELAPPVFGVVPTWDATLAALDDVIPDEIRPSLLHAEHDMHFHVPLAPGQTLVTQAEAYGIRPSRMGTRFTVRVASHDGDGRLALEQFGTMIVRAADGAAGGGAEAPGHAFPSAARAAKVAEVIAHVDADQTFRYRDASGDANPIHVDEAAARAAGLPGIILHGVCTMAMCGRAVVDGPADGDPRRLKRLAVRFYRPVYPGSDLVTTLYDAGDVADGRRAYAFEASSAGKVVVRDGWAEVEV
jgi:acyl dehydratase